MEETKDLLHFEQIPSALLLSASLKKDYIMKEQRPYFPLRVIFTLPEIAETIARIRAKRGQTILMVVRGVGNEVRRCDYARGSYTSCNFDRHAIGGLDHVLLAATHAHFDTLIFDWTVGTPDENGSVMQPCDDDQVAIMTKVAVNGLNDSFRSIWRLDPDDLEDDEAEKSS